MRRHALKIHGVISFLILVWLVVIRHSITGRMGWEMFFIIAFAFVFVVFQTLSYGLLKSRMVAMKASMIGKIDVILLWLVYACAFLFGFFIPYGAEGDYWYNKSYNKSVAMVVWGISKQQTSDIWIMLLWVCAGVSLVTFIVLLYERIKKRVL